MLNIKKITSFYELLKEEEMRDRIIGEMFVETTEVFRDPSFWRYIRENVIPVLPQDSTVWFPNEASGEEVYSLSIILNEQTLSDKINILCNNPSEYCCNNIRNGNALTKKYEINHSNYKRLENFDLFEKYFQHEGNVQGIAQGLKNIVRCKKTTYKEAVADEKVSMIFARNQALYFNHSFAEEYFTLLYEKLMIGGFLVIGVKENLPRTIDEKMNVISATEKVYRKD
jgi:chemotaxis protein methyltransferase CheR